MGIKPNLSLSSYITTRNIEKNFMDRYSKRKSVPEKSNKITAAIVFSFATILSVIETVKNLPFFILAKVFSKIDKILLLKNNLSVKL